jgi:hypothetical protein
MELSFSPAGLTEAGPRLSLLQACTGNGPLSRCETHLIMFSFNALYVLNAPSLRFIERVVVSTHPPTFSVRQQARPLWQQA